MRGTLVWRLVELANVFSDPRRIMLPGIDRAFSVVSWLFLLSFFARSPLLDLSACLWGARPFFFKGNKYTRQRSLCSAHNVDIN